MDHFINKDDYVDLLSNEKVKFIIYALFFIEWLYLKGVPDVQARDVQARNIQASGLKIYLLAWMT